MIFPEDLRNQIKANIAERCGLYFRDHDLRNLESAVFQRMQKSGFDSPHAYYIHLTADPERETEFRELLNLLTINHTYFFRNEPQFAALKEKVLPGLIDLKMQQAFARPGGARPGLRIWSAGCSTGEEPYTLAMVLREAVPHIEDWDIEIFATDASGDALEKAKRGVYGENSMRLVEEPYRAKYFTKIPSSRRQGAEWRISDEIKGMVKFGYLNLVGDPYPAEIDILFCRNVTIYFEIKTTLRIMDAFFESLTDPGILFLGYSESLQFLTDKFRMASWQDGIYYRKVSAKPEEPAPSVLVWRAEEPGPSDYIGEVPLPELAAVTETRQPAVLSEEDFKNVFVQISRLIYLKEYPKALSLIEKVSIEGPRMADIHYLAADVYANMNRHEEARARIRKALAIDSLFAPAYYLLGCILFEEGKIAEAKESLQKALYIDQDLIMARFYLAHLFRSEGRSGEAIREYRNTLAAISKRAADPRNEMVLQTSGFNQATLRSVCSDNLERLKTEP